MNILKPDQLSLTSQPLDWRGVLHQSFTVGLGFDLVSGAPLPADAAWAAAMQGLATGDCIDTGLPKKQPEWLLAGCAHSPGNAPMNGMLVQVCVGQSSREWLVRADAANTPFTAVPLIWANTWGSLKHPENPLGCGIEPGPDGKMQLPTVVEKSDLDRRPACPGPLGAWPCRMKNMGTYNAAWLKTRWPGVPDDFDWAFFNLAQPAQRLAELKGGEHLVLKHLHPDHPTLELNAPIHSIRVEIQRSQALAKDTAADPAWSQIAATRDTLWLFPNQLTGLYLWHALAPCADEAATDISSIRLTLDPPVAEKIQSAVLAQSAAAMEGATTEAVAAESLGLGGTTALTAGVVGVAGVASMTGGKDKPKAASTPTKSEAASNTMSATSPKALTSPPNTPSQEAQTSADASTLAALLPPSSSLKADILQDFDDSLDEYNAGLAKAGLPPLTAEQIAETKAQITRLADGIEAVNQQPPPPELADLLRQHGLPEERISAISTAVNLDLPDSAAYATQAEWDMAVDSYLATFTALLQPSEATTAQFRTFLRLSGPEGIKTLGLPPAPEPVDLLVERGLERSVAKKLLHRMENDNTPTDLPDLIPYTRDLEQDLGFPKKSISGMVEAVCAALVDVGLLDASEVAEATRAASISAPSPPASEPLAVPESAPKSGPEPAFASESAHTPVSKAHPPAPKSRDDVLAALALGLPLAGVCFAGLALSGLNFSDRDLQGAVFDGATLDETSFARSNISGGSFVGASLKDADFTAAVLTGASVAGANLHGASLHEAEATGLNATGAHMDRARLRFCTLDNADFSAASLNRADFHTASLHNVSFANANLGNASFGAQSAAPGLNCTGAVLAGSTWQGVSCVGGVFTGSKADGATFNDCDLSASSWRGAVAKNADFSRCNLHNADLEGANFFKASLREAKVETASLNGANLYGADLYRLGVGPQTGMAGTNTTATILAARKKVA